MFNTMNTVRPRPYLQRGTGNYNAGSDSTDKDGHNSNAQDQQQQQRQNQQTVARGRVEDVQQQAPSRQAIYSPAANAYPSAYPQRQTYKVNTPPPIRYDNHQVNPMQYQAGMQSGYHPINQQPQQAVQQQAPHPQQRSNKVNIAQILKDFRNTIKAIATPEEIVEQVNHYLEIVEQLVAQDLLHFRHGGAGVQAVGDQQQNVLLLHAHTVQLLQAGGDGNLPVAGGLAAALDDVGDDDDHLAALVGQLRQGGHADGVADALQGLGIQGVPVLGQALGVGNGNAGDKHIGVVGQVGGHYAFAVLKIKLHSQISFS